MLYVVPYAGRKSSSAHAIRAHPSIHAIGYLSSIQSVPGKNNESIGNRPQLKKRGCKMSYKCYCNVEGIARTS